MPRGFPLQEREAAEVAYDALEDEEISRRVITNCHIKTVTECRFWKCQAANRCMDGHLGPR